MQLFCSVKSKLADSSHDKNRVTSLTNNKYCKVYCYSSSSHNFKLVTSEQVKSAKIRRMAHPTQYATELQHLTVRKIVTYLTIARTAVA